MTRPSIEQLWTAPELAALAVLESAADMAVLALAAVYPEMHDIEDPNDHTDAMRAALSVIEHARALGFTLPRYRLALIRAQERDDALPF